MNNIDKLIDQVLEGSNANDVLESLLENVDAVLKNSYALGQKMGEISKDMDYKTYKIKVDQIVRRLIPKLVKSSDKYIKPSIKGSTININIANAHLLDELTILYPYDSEVLYVSNNGKIGTTSKSMYGSSTGSKNTYTSIKVPK